MTYSITHPFVSPGTQGTDSNRVYGPQWNSTHSISGTANTILAFDGSGAPISTSMALIQSVASLANLTTDNTVIRANGTLGGTQSTGVTIDDSNNITAPALTYFGSAAAASWNTLYSYGTHSTPAQAVSPSGQVAIYGAARASDNTTSTASPVGVMGWGFNENSTVNEYVWGGYFEGRNYSNAGGAHGIEVDVTQFGSVINLNTYSNFTSGAAIGVWVAAGGNITASNKGYNPYTGTTSLVASDASIGVGIINNGAKFQKGIMIGANALTGTDGVTGNGIAIEMAKGHAIEWQGTAGIVGARIRSDNAVSTGAMQVVFANDTIGFQVAAQATNGVAITGVASTVNYLTLFGAATGAAPTIQANGTDTNIPLNLQASGTGDIRMLSNITVRNGNSLFIDASGDAHNMELRNTGDALAIRRDAGADIFGLSSTGIVTSATWQGVKVGLAYGGTNADLSATGGTNQIVKQSGVGSALTVAALTTSEVTSGLGFTPVQQGTGTNQSGNTIKIGWGGVSNPQLRLTVDVTDNGFILTTSNIAGTTFYNATALAAGGTTGSGIFFSSVGGLGILFGSGAPTASAHTGALYLRSDGSNASNRAYINTGSTTWTALTTLA